MRGLKTAKEAKNKVSEIHPAVKVAIGVMLRQSKHDLAAAAREAGLSTERLRDYLSRPSVISYLRTRRRVEVESLCAGNIRALARLRDEGPPTAAVNAIRTAEAIRSELIAEDGVAGASRLAAPGLVIVVAPAPAVTVDQPRRLGAARSISEPGAIDPGFVDAEIIADDEPGGEVAATYSR
jgi:hypothetical protein